MTYLLEEEDPNSFRIVRDGRVLTTCGGDRAFAKRELQRYELDEAKSNHAIDSGDPLALCHLGWHRLALDSGPPEEVRDRAGFVTVPFYRFAAKIGEAGGTLVFRVADEPFLYAARTVKALGDLQPWRCAACGEHVPPRSE